MGDFGPAYMSSSRPTAASQLYRCDDCSITLPSGAASDDAHCPSCGGTLRSLGVGGTAPPEVPALAGLNGGGGPTVSAAEMASVVLSEILAPGLLESLGASAPALTLTLSLTLNLTLTLALALALTLTPIASLDP